MSMSLQVLRPVWHVSLWNWWVLLLKFICGSQQVEVIRCGRLFNSLIALFIWMDRCRVRWAAAWASYTQRAAYSQERGFSEQPQFLLRCVAMVGLPFQTGSDRAVRKRVGRQRSCRGKQFGERRPQCGHARPNPDVAMSKTMKTLAVPAGQMVSWVQACFWLFCCFTDWLVLMGVCVWQELLYCGITIMCLTLHQNYNFNKIFSPESGWPLQNSASGKAGRLLWGISDVLLLIQYRCFLLLACVLVRFPSTKSQRGLCVCKMFNFGQNCP